MGRRALRKTDPSLDLSRHLKTLDQLPRPWRAEGLFGRRAPLEVEVGSGKGLFVRAAAVARPDVDFLGIEIVPRYARFAAAGLARHGLDNAAVVIADAIRVLQEVLPEESVTAIHIYFPDPWWKRRHKKRRVMRESLARDVVRVLQPGGLLHFWTDVEEYFETAVGLFRETPGLDGPFEVCEAPAAHDMDYRTHFERRTRLHGATVFRTLFRRKCRPV
jgi:tRNA (guanine-N7-)-methyltransferase